VIIKKQIYIIRKNYNTMKDEEIWPNFFIVGAAKAGTTSLNMYLTQNPEIFMSKRKEPDYFSASTIPENIAARKPIRKQSQYLELFRNVKNEKIIGESSTSYLADPEAPKLIHKIAPNAKIIIMLRDPVERAFSHYLMLMGKNRINVSFHEQLQAEFNQRDSLEESIKLNIGLYPQHIKKYQEIFGLNQVKIIIFEEFIKDINAAVNKILPFLELNTRDDIIKAHVYNPYSKIRGPISQQIFKNSVISKIATKILPVTNKRILRDKLLFKKLPKPKLPKEDGMLLQKFYQEEVNNLEKILGRKLPWRWFDESQI